MSDADKDAADKFAALLRAPLPPTTHGYGTLLHYQVRHLQRLLSKELRTHGYS